MGWSVSYPILFQKQLELGDTTMFKWFFYWLLSWRMVSARATEIILTARARRIMIRQRAKNNGLVIKTNTRSRLILAKADAKATKRISCARVAILRERLRSMKTARREARWRRWRLLIKRCFWSSVSWIEFAAWPAIKGWFDWVRARVVSLVKKFFQLLFVRIPKFIWYRIIVPAWKVILSGLKWILNQLRKIPLPAIGSALAVLFVALTLVAIIRHWPGWMVGISPLLSLLSWRLHVYAKKGPLNRAVIWKMIMFPVSAVWVAVWLIAVLT